MPDSFLALELYFWNYKAYLDVATIFRAVKIRVIGFEQSDTGRYKMCHHVIIRECAKEVNDHLAFHKISDDSGVNSEWKLLLGKTGDVQRSIYCFPETPF